jgi:uncharacterized protein YigE (DUF2233 family)
MNKLKLLLTAVALMLAVQFGWHLYQMATQSAFISYRADLRRQQLRLYWKDERNHRFSSLEGLKKWLAAHQQQLVFAMNAGMFNPAYAPQGLFIQQGKTITPLDTASGPGNFYLKPNGVFYLSADTTAHICQTADFRDDGRVAFATQSGPMLVVDGRIHPAFRASSANVQIRNGVGLLPDGQVLLAMSRRKISFYDFAEYFRQAGCRQALYLDGFVSRTYEASSARPQTDGDFGVIIGVSEPQR